MNTRTKLSIASFVGSTMSLLVVCSHVLHLSNLTQWALLISMWIPLGLIFSYSKKLKEESAMELAAGIVSEAKVAEEQKRIRRRLIIIWIGLFPFTLSFPFWMPIASGVSLGKTGDFIVAAVTFIFVSVVFAVRLKKMPNQAPEPTAPSGRGSS